MSPASATHGSRIAELEAQPVDRDARIAVLKQQIEVIESDRKFGEVERDEASERIVEEFAALADAINDLVPIRLLPVSLRPQFEELAVSLGAARSW